MDVMKSCPMSFHRPISLSNCKSIFDGQVLVQTPVCSSWLKECYLLFARIENLSRKRRRPWWSLVGPLVCAEGLRYLPTVARCWWVEGTWKGINEYIKREIMELQYVPVELQQKPNLPDHLCCINNLLIQVGFMEIKHINQSTRGLH